MIIVSIIIIIIIIITIINVIIIVVDACLEFPCLISFRRYQLFEDWLPLVDKIIMGPFINSEQLYSQHG